MVYIANHALLLKIRPSQYLLDSLLQERKPGNDKRRYPQASNRSAQIDCWGLNSDGLETSLGMDKIIVSPGFDWIRCPCRAWWRWLWSRRYRQGWGSCLTLTCTRGWWCWVELWEWEEMLFTRSIWIYLAKMIWAEQFTAVGVNGNRKRLSVQVCLRLEALVSSLVEVNQANISLVVS